MSRSKANAKETRLHENQVLVLQILYKFRFSTVKLTAQYKGIKRSSVNESLLTLLKAGYIDRRYSNAYKIRGESARYFLTSKGVKYLKTKFTLSDKMIQAIYKNRIVSDPFIDHNLAVSKAYLILQNQYKDRYNVFTKAELVKFNNYPEQLPDLFLASKGDDKDYMLDIFLTEPFFVIKKRIQYYIEHRNEEWNESEPYPSILLVCPDARNEEKVIKYTESQLEDFDFLVSTVKAFMGEPAEIWTSPVEPEVLISL